ncbi:uncharacterized protein GGS25DRAFT_518391 [Hypoxylon fragiforme]|uniref:uncharacterized protein n=1 Tax=Hypoxylon fragiforme TaxID=63214 RepID=UPI0020C699AC|nr:uncharacterized protein GGS25DRAFT_518391 [Hypoxylon fragiforme]KAI2612706.1 hypothetical protein GGS25DRAFT_518391 [Hypoxylon fragiforme]
MATDDVLKPRVLLVSLQLSPSFDHMYGSFLAKLASRSTIRRVKKEESAIRLLSEEPRFSAVIVTDAAPSLPENSAVWDAVLEYVRQGGTSVLMAEFPLYVRHSKMGSFFSKAGLSWKFGAFFRTNVTLNRNSVSPASVAHLPPEYSQLATYIRDVAPADAWYTTTENSIIEPCPFAPEVPHNVTQISVALACVGNGKLGYVGDVDAEEGSADVALAMCGLSP